MWLGPESVAAHRADLAAFVERAARLDAATVIRLRARSAGEFTAWASTGLDVLASRVVAGVVRPDDLSVGADELGRGLAASRHVGLRRSRLSDGLRVARRLAAGLGIHPSRRRAGPSAAGLGAARFAAGQRAQQRARAAGIAAGPGGDPGQRGRRQRRRADALRIRSDRNGFPAAGCRRHRLRARLCGSAFCGPGCASTRGSVRCTAAVATRRSYCADQVE